MTDIQTRAALGSGALIGLVPGLVGGGGSILAMPLRNAVGTLLHRQGGLRSIEIALRPEGSCACKIGGAIGRFGKSAVLRDDMRTARPCSPKAQCASGSASGLLSIMPPATEHTCVPSRAASRVRPSGRISPTCDRYADRRLLGQRRLPASRHVPTSPPEPRPRYGPDQDVATIRSARPVRRPTRHRLHTRHADVPCRPQGPQPELDVHRYEACERQWTGEP